MYVTHDPEQVFGGLIAWGEQQETVRAMLLTSNRAIEQAHVDIYSDYDVVLVVTDIHPWHSERSWIDHFGDVLGTYWDTISPNLISASRKPAM